MIALLLAAATAASSPANVHIVDQTPILRRAMGCGLFHSVPAALTAPGPQAKRLGTLPRANWELPLLRLDANGCQKAVIVGYGVERDGRAPAEDAK